MTTALRYNNLDSDRPPMEFGARYDHTSTDSKLERLGDAVGMTIDTSENPHLSPFDDYYPWAGMRRCNLGGISGDVEAYHGDLDEDGAALYSDTAPKVMVEVPKFWFKYEHTGDYYDYWVSPYPIKGYRLHPVFLRYGVPVDKVYVGAFETYISSAYTYSMANATPATSTTRTVFRTDTVKWNSTAVAGFGWGLLGYTTLSAIQLLYLIEYADFDSQQAINEGLTHVAAVQVTGWTSGDGIANHTDLGNGTGFVDLWGVSAGDYAVSYRGIENLWGNTWTVIDGMNINTTHKPYVNYGGGADSDTISAGYTISKNSFPAASGYQQLPYITDAFKEAGQFQPETVAGTDSTNMCDYYTVASNWAIINVLRSGGCYDSGNEGGLFTINADLAIAGNNSRTGSRIQFIPYDYTSWGRY